MTEGTIRINTRLTESEFDFLLDLLRKSEDYEFASLIIDKLYQNAQ